MGSRVQISTRATAAEACLCIARLKGSSCSCLFLCPCARARPLVLLSLVSCFLYLEVSRSVPRCSFLFERLPTQEFECLPTQEVSRTPLPRGARCEKCCRSSGEYLCSIKHYLGAGYGVRYMPSQESELRCSNPNLKRVERVYTGVVVTEPAHQGTSWSAPRLETGGKSPTEVPRGRQLPVAPPSCFLENAPPSSPSWSPNLSQPCGSRDTEANMVCRTKYRSRDLLSLSGLLPRALRSYC